MTLRLPKPLPPDYIDEWIDERIAFQTFFWYMHDEDDNPIPGSVEYVLGARPLDDAPLGFIRDLFEFRDNDYPANIEEDEEGYCKDFEGGWCWTAKELTEEEIDSMLQWSTIV